jgi:hypothetical protein
VLDVGGSLVDVVLDVEVLDDVVLVLVDVVEVVAVVVASSASSSSPRAITTPAGDGWEIFALTCGAAGVAPEWARPGRLPAAAAAPAVQSVAAMTAPATLLFSFSGSMRILQSTIVFGERARTESRTPRLDTPR